jgi:hypothetical protein
VSEQRVGDGWEEWRNHVLAEQQRFSTALLTGLEDIHEVRSAIAILLETKKQVDDLAKKINDTLVPGQRELFVRVGLLSGAISLGTSTVISLVIWFLTSR